MSHPIDPETFKSMVPSSKATPKPGRLPQKLYTITVQRKERSGRWNQVASWMVSTDEDDMQGPLAMGLKDNYRIVVREGKPPPIEDSNDGR